MEEEPEAALEHRELHHGEEVDGELLEAGGEPSALLEPADDALDDAAPAVGRRVEARVRALVGARRDHRADPPPAQVAPHGAIAVALVSGSAWGRVRGRPPRRRGRWTRRSSGSTWRDSWASPGVRSAARGTPPPSTRRWSLVPNPPRERPSA